MAQHNQWTGLGYTTRDAELRYTPKGVAVAEFTLGCNRTWKGPDGAEHEEVLFMPCVCWNKLAEIAGQYIRKGRLVLAVGRMTEEHWEDKQSGQKRSRMKCTLETLQLCDKAQGGENAPARSASRPSPGPGPQPGPPSNAGPEETANAQAPGDDDVPF